MDAIHFSYFEPLSKLYLLFLYLESLFIFLRKSIHLGAFKLYKYLIKLTRKSKQDLHTMDFGLMDPYFNLILIKNFYLLLINYILIT